MSKSNKKTLIITSIIILLPIVVGLLLWNKFPDRLAVHFTLDNNVDKYSSKFFTIVVIPLFLFILHIFGVSVMNLDPKKENISDKIRNLVLWIVPCISTYVMFFIYSYNLGIRLNIELCFRIFLGLFYIILGNYLPKIRQNNMIGLRLPWTLKDEDIWNKSHRMTGILWVFIGIFILISSMVNYKSIIILFVLFIISVIVPVLYSAVIYIRKKRTII